MTRPNALVGALAAVGVGTLLWLAWLIVAADLTLWTSIAAWGLWLLVLLTATTAVAYARELVRHHGAAPRRGAWKPLPSLVLLWIGGLTAVPVLALMLPSSAAPVPAKATSSAGVLSSRPAFPTGSSASSTPTPSPRTTRSQASRSADRSATTTTTSPTPRRTPRGTTTTGPTPTATTRPTRPPTTTTTTPTTTPIIDITVLPNGHTKTKPPGR